MERSLGVYVHIPFCPGKCSYCDFYSLPGSDKLIDAVVAHGTADEIAARLAQHVEAGADHVLVMGDLNVGHREFDIKNWKGNVKNSGFLPEERAYFDKYFGEAGYVDVARTLAGDVDASGHVDGEVQRGRSLVGRRAVHEVAPPLEALQRVRGVRRGRVLEHHGAVASVEAAAGVDRTVRRRLDEDATA